MRFTPTLHQCFSTLRCWGWNHLSRCICCGTNENFLKHQLLWFCLSSGFIFYKASANEWSSFCAVSSNKNNKSPQIKWIHIALLTICIFVTKTRKAKLCKNIYWINMFNISKRTRRRNLKRNRIQKGNPFLVWVSPDRCVMVKHTFVKYVIHIVRKSILSLTGLWKNIQMQECLWYIKSLQLYTKTLHLEQ